MAPKAMSTDQKMAAMTKKFKSMDKNHDGTLSLDELKDMLMKGAKAMEPDEVTALYASVDANKDGTVSFDEFLNFVYKGDHGANRSTAGRHGRLAAQSGPCNDGTEGDWGPCKRTFENFAGQDMDGKEFMKFCKDNKLFGKGFQNVDVDLTFAKVVPKGQRRMDFEMFKDACRIIAGKRNIDNSKVQEIVSDSAGPILKGTEAEAVRFHDDKSTYTGAHAQNETHVGVDASARQETFNRHDKMAEQRASNMEANAADQDPWDECERVFRSFAGESLDLDGKEFYNMCMSIDGLVQKSGGKFVKEDIDTVFASVCPRGKRRIQFSEEGEKDFQGAIKTIALKKGEACHITQGCIARSKGPTMHGVTEAEYVKFHDDKDTYTGTHVGKD